MIQLQFVNGSSPKTPLAQMDFKNKIDFVRSYSRDFQNVRICMLTSIFRISVNINFPNLYSYFLVLYMVDY